MNTVQEKSTATQTRVITIVTTRGEKVKLEFAGAKWSELEQILARGGKDVNGNRFSPYELNNMKCVESIRRSTLEHPDAVVPSENFNLFLMPLKSKSGGMSRADIYVQIKKHIAKDGDAAKNHFSDGGQNYTRVSSSVLEEKLESYAPGSQKAAAKVKKEAIADVVASVAASKENGNLKDELSRLSVDEKLDFIIDMLTDIRKNGGSVATEVAEAKVAEVIAPAKPVETEEARIAREKKEAQEKADREEDEKLEKEMRELAGGFNDVKR